MVYEQQEQQQLFRDSKHYSGLISLNTVQKTAIQIPEHIVTKKYAHERISNATLLARSTVGNAV